MLATTRKTVFATALAASTPGLGIAQELSPRTGGDQFKSLSDAYWKARSDLRQAGVDLKLSNTNFYQGLAAGTGDHSFEFGGKFEALATFDLSRFGFWSGFSLTTKFEHNYGESANGRGGTLLPVNTALAFPGLGNHQGSDLSTFYLTQKFNDMFSLSVGKFNMIDKVAATPLRGGGNDTFMNVGLAAPVTGLTPPYIFGAIATIKTEPAIFTVMAYDPKSAVHRSGFEDPFRTGVTFLGSVTVPVKPFGLTGYQGFKVITSTKNGTDLANVPQLLLPPEARGATSTKGNPWFVSYSFQQYLVQDPNDPGTGWGIFGEIGISDGNPTPLDWSAYFGIGGTSPLPGRTQDRFGVGYFRYSLSNDLVAGLLPVVVLRDEQGIEIFYNFAVTNTFKVTADVQIITPVLGGRNTAVVTGLRTQVLF
jgi:porin